MEFQTEASFNVSLLGMIMNYSAKGLWEMEKSQRQYLGHTPLNRLKTTFIECHATQGSKRQTFILACGGLLGVKMTRAWAAHCNATCPVCGRLVLAYTRIYAVSAKDFGGSCSNFYLLHFYLLMNFQNESKAWFLLGHS